MFNLTEDRVNVNHHAILLDIVTRRKFRYDGYLTISVIKLLLSVVVVVVDGWSGEVREILVGGWAILDDPSPYYIHATTSLRSPTNGYYNISVRLLLVLR